MLLLLSWAAAAAFDLGRESEEGRESIGPARERATGHEKNRPRGRIGARTELGLGPDRERKEFSIFQIFFSILFSNSNRNVNLIKFEYLKYTF